MVPFIVIEPDYWALKDTSYRQYIFLKECIASLQQDIESLGGNLCIKTGNVEDVLNRFHQQYGEMTLWAHQETGNMWTFERDKRVRAWCKAHHIKFYEPQQFGIWRGSSLNRDTWSQRWDAMMSKPILPALHHIRFVQHDESHIIPQANMLGLQHDGITDLQKGGRAQAERDMRSFLHERGEQYRTDMSSPITGEWGCSRLSAHLAYGTLSMREIYQATKQRVQELRALPKDERGTWLSSLSSFNGRLHWHCHFSQKLELEPELEFLPMARSYIGVRDNGDDLETLTAYANGQTGYPFIDACMRYLKATGWINFRMRAMLMSFASYDLWLPWQKSGDVLARYFTDYDPGIHWPQSQMQSGVTGINTIRIYSPVKQGLDQDPSGDFTRKWVPELKNLSGKKVHEPWKYESESILHYPTPIVDHAIAVKKARDALWAIRKTPQAKLEAEDVYLKHGSRKRPTRRASKKKGDT